MPCPANIFPMEKQAKLFLLPTPLGENAIHTIPAYVIETIHQLDVFVVERAKTARKFLKAVGFPKAYDDCLFFELNKRTQANEIASFLDPIKEGRSVGLLSEAGVPAVADPGSQLILNAHRRNIEVAPLVGPSSILLAIMASGMNGQSFSFKGYLSPKRPILAKDLKKMEAISARQKETQIFIETPYRNTAFFETALQVLSPSTLFCVATDLSLPTESVVTKRIRDWQKTDKPELHKRPSIFLLLS